MVNLNLEFLRRRLRLVAVIALGLGIRIVVGLTQPYDWDASIMLYQAQQLSHGSPPFSSVLTDTPAYIYWLALLGSSFGFSLAIIAFTSILAALISLLFIYLISRDLFGDRIGILASALYAVLPTAALFGFNELYRSAVLALVLPALFLTFHAGRSAHPKLLVLCAGLLIGVAFWVYVGSAIVLAVILVAQFVLVPDLRLAFGRAICAVGGAMSTVGSGLLLLETQVSFAVIDRIWWHEEILGFGQNSGVSRFGSMLGFDEYAQYMARFSYTNALYWLPLVLLAAPVLASMILRDVEMLRTERARFFALGVISSGIFSLLWLVSEGAFVGPVASYGATPLPLIYTVMLIVIAFIGFALGISLIGADSLAVSLGRRGRLSLYIWIGFMALYIFTFTLPHMFYFYWAFVPVVTILAGVCLSHLLRNLFRWNRSSILRTTFTLLVVASVATNGLIFLTTTTPGITLYPSAVDRIAEYLDAHTTSGQVIFSAEPIYSVYSHRQNAGGLDNFYIYVSDTNGSVNSSPVVRDIYGLISSSSVSFVIMDSYNATWTFLAHYPMLMSVFLYHYGFTAKVADANLWAPRPPTSYIISGTGPAPFNAEGCNHPSYGQGYIAWSNISSSCFYFAATTTFASLPWPGNYSAEFLFSSSPGSNGSVPVALTFPCGPILAETNVSVSRLASNSWSSVKVPFYDNGSTITGGCGNVGSLLSGVEAIVGVDNVFDVTGTLYFHGIILRVPAYPGQ